MPGPSQLKSLYNTTINDNITKAIEGRPLLDPVMDSSISQLRKAMIETFEPNKLNSQTSFRAICLMQLESIKVKDKKKIRIKARIPEIHTLLPIPVNGMDLIHIATYPTFVGDAESLNVPEGVDGVPEGSEVEVTFGNTNNFTQPKLTKVLRWGPNGMAADANGGVGGGGPSSAAASKSAGSKRSKSSDGSGDDEGAESAGQKAPGWTKEERSAQFLEAMGFDKEVPWVGVNFVTEALKAAGVAPLSDWRGIKRNEDQWMMGWTPKVKHGWLQLRNDVMPGFVNLYKKLKELGGRMTSAGMLRPISSDKAKGIGEAMFSFHHCGRAFDLARDAGGLTGPKYVRKKIGGVYVRTPKDDKFGANAPWKKKGRVITARKPYVITVNEADDRFWHVWCQVIDEDKRNAHYAKWGVSPIQIGEYKYTPPQVETGEEGRLPLQMVDGVPQAQTFGLGSEGVLHAPISNKEVAVRRLNVMVRKGGSRYMTVEQDVLCFSFTDWAQEFGFDHIGCAQWKKKPRRIAASKIGIPGACLEWWHFQSPINLTKGQLYIDDIRQIYSPKKIAGAWGRTVHWCKLHIAGSGWGAEGSEEATMSPAEKYTPKKKKVMFGGKWPHGISDQIVLKTLKMWQMKKGKAQLKGWFAGQVGASMATFKPCPSAKKPKK